MVINRIVMGPECPFGCPADAVKVETAADQGKSANNKTGLAAIDLDAVTRLPAQQLLIYQSDFPS